MKKIVSILSTGLSLLAAFSCTQVEKITVNNKDSVAPVLGTVTVGNDVVAAYTPATFYLGDDVVSPTLVTHTIALVKLDGEDLSVNLNAKDSGTTLKVDGSNLSNALKGLGCEANSTHAIELVVRAALSSTANTGFLDSESRIEANWTVVEKSGGNPYAGFEPTEEWSVIGSIASTGNNWGQDEPMLTDGTWFVCRGIELTTTDQFKFRKDHDWGTNFGAASSITEEPYVVTLGEELEAGAGGKNLAVPADGKYDLLLNPEAGVYKVIEAQEAVAADFYAGFEETEVWSVIGSITSTGNNWGQDEPMLTDGTWYVCKGIELVTADQFKFRKDHDWGTNFGAGPEISEEPYIAALGEELPAGPGGKNLGVAEDGTYDLLLNPDAAVYKIIKSGDDPQL